nr:hypothetical protein [Jeotgalibaca sp. MA1X17-3]
MDIENHFLEKLYKKKRIERVDALQKALSLTSNQVRNLLEGLPLEEDTADSMIENQLATYQLPYGVALNFLINDEKFVVPMAIEEPSVIAAASSAAKFFSQYGGFQTAVTERMMIGQAVLTGVPDMKKAIQSLEKNEENIVQMADNAHPSIVKRGGGAVSIQIKEINANRELDYPDFLIVHLYVETLEAMGANIINTMMEAVLPLWKNIQVDKL